MYANTNAPPAVAASAILYVLRCLVKRDIPLNQVPLALAPASSQWPQLRTSFIPLAPASHQLHPSGPSFAPASPQWPQLHTSFPS